jgi:hypothetical protein
MVFEIIKKMELVRILGGKPLQNLTLGKRKRHRDSRDSM